MQKRQEKLLELLHKTLKSFGYLKGETVKDPSRVYYQLYPTSDKHSILIYVANSHNNYCHAKIATFREICKNLIDKGYEISMTYPCYITVTHIEFDHPCEEETYYYSQ